MSCKSYILILLALMLTCSIEAKDKKKKAAAPATETENKNAQADTVSVSDFSYAMGVAQTGGLINYISQRLNVDTLHNMKDFQKGVQTMFKAGNDPKKVAYSAGMQVGYQVSQQFVDQLNQQITGEKDQSFIDVEAYKQGFIDAFLNKNSKMTLDSASQIANSQMALYKTQLMEKKYGQNRRDGEAFLAENAKKEGVTVLPSGVQYKIIKQGKGEKPTSTSNVRVNYEGKLIDGTVFDSSYKRSKPATFRLNQVIKGWTQAMQLMPVGSTWEIYIPQELAYGDRESGPIPPFSALIFKVELLDIVTTAKK